MARACYSPPLALRSCLLYRSLALDDYRRFVAGDASRRPQQAIVAAAEGATAAFLISTLLLLKEDLA